MDVTRSAVLGLLVLTFSSLQFWSLALASCDSYLCEQRGHCVDTPDGPICNCYDGFTGKRCENCLTDNKTAYCSPKAIHCQKDINGTMTCSCFRGYRGRLCKEDFDECTFHGSPCLNNGNCINTVGSYHCVCQNGWTGRHCQYDTNKCQYWTCQHGACVNLQGDYRCDCDPGWTGKNCDTDLCSLCTHGTCNQTSVNTTCTCHSGWEGDTCSTDIDECSPRQVCTKDVLGADICVSVQVACGHGTCNNLPGTYSCTCNSGWTGANCSTDIDECSLNTTCVHGTCFNQPGTFNCSCHRGWLGRRCSQDINECVDRNNCLHGTCMNTPGSYVCNCEPGWHGDSCDQPHAGNETACQLYKPCQHGYCNNSHVHGYECSCFVGWTGMNCMIDVDECASLNPCGVNFTCVNAPGNYSCRLPTVKQDLKLEDAILVSCDDYGWTIRVDMGTLRLVNPGARGSDIYLGDNSCTGTMTGHLLVIQHGLDQCLTTQKTINGSLVYSNELVYAEHDPLLPFIIKHYNWTVSVECDIAKNQSETVHVHHDLHGNGEHHVTGSSHYSVNMSFYSDPNFLTPVPSNPLHVAVGTRLYVKVFSTVPDWSVSMKVHTCYTKPGPDAASKFFYYLIKDGCEANTNTHIISQSTHETRFVFDDFEYTTNHEGIYVSCDATFCGPNDTSPVCRLVCDPSDIVPIV